VFTVQVELASCVGKPPQLLTVGRLDVEDDAFDELKGWSGTSKMGVSLGVGIVTSMASGETNIPAFVTESSEGEPDMENLRSNLCSSQYSGQRD
jgi:hypothetical protein